MSVKITEDDFDIALEHEQLKSRDAGAIVTFTGYSFLLVLARQESQIQSRDGATETERRHRPDAHHGAYRYSQSHRHVVGFRLARARNYNRHRVLDP